ncbi:RNA polymerase sigma-70 factor (ECF subfamily) [Novosphingobium sp. PhB165]|uniref:RNA polymerase sigma factor n=1 Tax=Novosphingobium sp. PhB165 TaxID=2485105 RepID=UPI001049D363|nr:RNA polymerase sigma factor [Novosphingobium sp. PhB165]TCM20543.1 RNA polymerase sigma-70 factor (ECF subfamily) [Novosphingobium sp. PhB165]
MIDLAACTDGELAALALGGRQAAYRALMDRHRGAAFRLARHHCGDDDAALDVTQQSFIAAFAALRRYDGARPFAHWLARIVINKSHDWARRRKVRQFFTFAVPLDSAHGVAEPTPDAERQTADRQELERTMHAIAALPAKLKEALILRAIEGLSQTEAAAVLGVSEKAVETRLYRARARLSENLSEKSARKI